MDAADYRETLRAICKQSQSPALSLFAMARRADPIIQTNLVSMQSAPPGLRRCQRIGGDGVHLEMPLLSRCDGPESRD